MCICLILILYFASSFFLHFYLNFVSALVAFINFPLSCLGTFTSHHCVRNFTIVTDLNFWAHAHIRMLKLVLCVNVDKFVIGRCVDVAWEWSMRLCQGPRSKIDMMLHVAVIAGIQCRPVCFVIRLQVCVVAVIELSLVSVCTWILCSWLPPNI